MELMVTEMIDMLEAKVIGNSKRSLNRKLRLCMNSKECQSGEIFIAIKGKNFDAHDFISQAMEQGALMAIVNEDWAKENKDKLKVYIPVKDTREALLLLAKRYGHLFKATKVAVTGSNGKTTVKDMLSEILSTAFKDEGGGIATDGNFNNQIGLPLTMFRMMKEHKYAVLEIGTNEPGEIKVLSRTVVPDIAVITNIGHSHIAGFKDISNVRKEKLEITKGLKKNGFLVINADDPNLSNLRSTMSYRLITFGINRGEFKPGDLKWDENGCASFRIGRTKYALKVPGVHNLYNALAAIAVCDRMGVAKNIISKALSKYKGTKLRMEIKNISGIKLIEDCYNANPSSVKSALQTFNTMKSNGKRYVVLGDMLELGEDEISYHEGIGEIIAELNVDCLCTNGRLAKSIGKGALAKGFSSDKWKHFEAPKDLSDFLESNLDKGDLCLLKASRGMKFEKIADRVLLAKTNEGI